ncbi:hypothetical protein JW960_11510 [candidate division KSB1 bacterium]|nr:hypothetical protein [candidate division KSB1 bacterium]
MLLIDLLIALFVAILFSFVFMLGIRWERKGNVGIVPPAAYIFIIIFIFTWAGGIWLVPMGPRAWNIYWLPFFMVGLVVTLMLMTILPQNRENSSSTIELVNKEKEKRVEMETVKTLSIFFWILLLVLGVTIGIHYLS